jgi:hypothetical protein
MSESAVRGSVEVVLGMPRGSYRLGVALVVAVGVGYSTMSASSVAAPPPAHAASGLVVNQCTGSRVNLKRWLAFNASFTKYEITHMFALVSATAMADGALAEAELDADNVPAMMAHGKLALADIELARKALDQLGLDHAAMNRNHPFGDNKHTETLIDVALYAMNKRIKDTFTALDTLNAAAEAYAAGDRDGGMNLTHEGVSQTDEAEGGLANVAAEIRAALIELRTECPNAAQSVAPMSASQIDRDSGGGGSQRASAQRFTVLAPKRMRLNHNGRTLLPLTLTIPTNSGDVQVTVARGNTLITSVDVSMGARHGAGGLLLKLPAKTSPGSVQLTAVFTPGASASSVTIKLPIRLL